tara:strand:+ start:912 stop:1556 length:645 start_codon:yes stop_codon:yes gene_type:complete
MFLAQDLEDIKFYRLMCELQDKIYIQLEKNILTTKTEIGKTCYLRFNDSKKSSERGLKEVWTHLGNAMNRDDCEFLVSKLEDRHKTPWRLMNDLSNGKMQMIGAIGTDHPFQYYKGAGYILKYNRGDDNCFYHHLSNDPPVIKENLKSVNPTEICLQLSKECQTYFNNLIEQLKIKDAELDKKAQQVHDFIQFLNLTPNQVNYVLGTYLRDFKE